MLCVEIVINPDIDLLALDERRHSSGCCSAALAAAATYPLKACGVQAISSAEVVGLRHRRQYFSDVSGGIHTGAERIPWRRSVERSDATPTIRVGKGTAVCLHVSEHAETSQHAVVRSVV